MEGTDRKFGFTCEMQFMTNTWKKTRWFSTKKRRNEEMQKAKKENPDYGDVTYVFTPIER